MKINRNDIDRVYNSPAITDNSTSDKKAKTGAPVSKDKVILSDKAKEYSTMGSLANSVVKEVTQPTSPEKLLKLKSEIASGTYHVPSEQIAASLLGLSKE